MAWAKSPSTPEEIYQTKPRGRLTGKRKKGEALMWQSFKFVVACHLVDAAAEV